MRTKVNVLLTLAISTLLVFAGCAGKGKDVPPGEPVPTEPTVSADKGSVSGIVVSEEVVGIADADLLLKESEQGAESDGDGKFVINDVAPGRYTLLVAALGYDSKAQMIEVLAGQVSEATITLSAVSVPVPRHESVPFVGHFECSWAAADQVWADCDPTGGDILQGSEMRFSFNKTEQVDYIVAELRWTAASAGSGKNLDFNLVGGQDHEDCQWYANVFGPAPLKIIYEVGKKFSNPQSPNDGVGTCGDEVLDPEEPELGLDLYASPVYADEMGVPERQALVGLTIQQNYEGYITYFYDDVPAEDFSAFGDA